MILALLLAIPRCADPGFCPSRVELERAIESDRQVLEAYINHIEGEAHPESPTTVALPRPLSISAISCGHPFNNPPRALECRFTLHYTASRERRTATLAPVAGIWRIIQAKPAPRR